MVFKKKTFRKFTKNKKQDRRISQIEKAISTVELKGLQVYYPSANCVITGTFNPIHVIEQGNNYFQRTGDQVNSRILKLKWWWQNSDIANYSQIRGILVRALIPAASVLYSNMLDTTVGSVAFAAPNPVYTKINTGNKFIKAGVQYEILYDTGMMWIAPYQVTNAGSPNVKLVNKTFRLPAKKVTHFTGTANNTYDVGALYWFTSASDVDVLNGGNTMVYFTDLD